MSIKTFFQIVAGCFTGSVLGIAFVILVFATSGCTAMQSKSEIAWQAMHAADVAMTNNIVDDPCYSEGHPITRAMIGEEPTHKSVAIWGVGEALAHAAVSDFLLTHDHDRLFKIWQVISIGDAATSMGQGLSIGVRFGGRNKPCVSKQPSN